ncbi:MAG: hypothetical protein ABIT47_02960 [Candidatus Paceibacterota bacterium]
MKRIFFIALIIVVVGTLIAGLAMMMNPTSRVLVNTQATTTPTTVVKDVTTTKSNQNTGSGTFAYQCDEHVSMTLTPSADLKTIAIKSISGNYPPTATLTYIPAKTGVRYEGKGVVLTAHGETITLGEGDSAINCSPAELPDMAPLNFGD